VIQESIKNPENPEIRHANVVGLGLIGGSVALALKSLGFVVHGDDEDPERVSEALQRKIIDQAGVCSHAVVSFAATPVLSLGDTVQRLLRESVGFVTDVGSVKSEVVHAITDPRFIGGHPMAGSELDGLDGADASMFTGAVWVLTPTVHSSDDSFSTFAELCGDFGAEVVALDPLRHDDFVAIISHVPHLTAAALMGLADEKSEEHLALLRLAAGGFRDMTRIASGRPEIWLDICHQNQDAIVRTLDRFIEELTQLREIVRIDDKSALLGKLNRARRARMNLPLRAGPVEELAEVRIPIPDQPGSAANIFALSGELGVNIYDFEVVHSAEGDRGVIVVIIGKDHVELFRGGLMARGFRPAVSRLS
jgi:prephenate dehydrogenase